jgi:hypothetical protein
MSASLRYEIQMKILRVAVAALATWPVAATARNSDHSDLSWALGYVSGMATSNAEEVRMERQAGKEERADVKPIDERKLIAQIRQQCLRRPNVFFALIVEWAATEM